MAQTWTATTSSSRLVKANPNRTRLNIQNYGDAEVNLGIGAAATTDKGPRLATLATAELTGAAATQEIHVITASGTASGTWY